jgi:hypothetical protein
MSAPQTGVVRVDPARLQALAAKLAELGYAIRQMRSQIGSRRKELMLLIHRESDPSHLVATIWRNEYLNDDAHIVASDVHYSLLRYLEADTVFWVDTIPGASID